LPLFSITQEAAKNNFIKQSKTMEERWEMGTGNDKGLFLVISYNPVYFTAGRWSGNTNTTGLQSPAKYHRWGDFIG
jgi:hypothetical protein